MAKRETISNVVRRALLTSGRSMYSVSAESGVAASQISRFLSGQLSITLDTLDKLAPILGLRLVVEKPTAKQRKPKQR